MFLLGATLSITPLDIANLAKSIDNANIICNFFSPLSHFVMTEESVSREL